MMIFRNEIHHSKFVVIVIVNKSSSESTKYKPQQFDISRTISIKNLMRMTKINMGGRRKSLLWTIYNKIERFTCLIEIIAIYLIISKI